MRKYEKQFRKKYESREVAGSYTFHDRAVSVTIEHITRHDGELIGTALVNALACQSFSVEWNGETELWLEEFDFGLFDAASFENLLQEICKEYGIELLLYDTGAQ